MTVSVPFDALATQASQHDEERRQMVLLTAAAAGVAVVATCAQNAHRSIKPAYFVAVGSCTHPGRSPNVVAAGSANSSVGPTGQVVFSAHATAPPLIGRAACSRTSRHRPIWRCRSTSVWLKAGCLLAKTAQLDCRQRR